ncbi:MAG: glycosyltransferase, partial [Methylotenera sp.]
DVLLFFRYLRVLKQEKPDIFLGYTIKPNIYGSLASHFLDIPVINNIAGLGSGFIKNNFLTKLLKILYKVALK